MLTEDEILANFDSRCSLIDMIRKRALVSASIAQASKGHLAEFGVFKGGTACLMAAALKTTDSPFKLHLFDSWSGLPAPTSQDGARLWKGLLQIDKSHVQRLLAERHLENYVVFHDGLFQNTLPGFAEVLSLAHVDGDLYESTRCCLIHLHSKMAGPIIVDDYRTDRFTGVTRAVDEFLAANPEWKLTLLGGMPDGAARLERISLEKP